MESTSPLLRHRSREVSEVAPSVEIFFQTVSRRLRARVVNRSAKDIPIRVCGVEIRSLGEVQTSTDFHGGVFSGALRFGNSRLTGLIIMQQELLTRVISVLLGDDPLAEDVPTSRRELTAVEQRIGQRLCTDLISVITRSWPESHGPEIHFGGLVGQPRITDPALSAIPVYTATLSFGPPDAPFGMLGIAIPLHTLTGTSYDEEQRSESTPSSVVGMDTMMPVELELVAELTRMNLTVNELRGLAPGDLIPLGTVKETVVKINGHAVFAGEAGVSTGNRSIRLIRRVD